MDAQLARRVMADVEGDIGVVDETTEQASRDPVPLLPGFPRSSPGQGCCDGSHTAVRSLCLLCSPLIKLCGHSWQLDAFAGASSETTQMQPDTIPGHTIASLC